MFGALTCPSSGGQIVLSQHLVSSLSVNDCTVCRMRADCSTILDMFRALTCPSSGGQIVLSQHHSICSAVCPHTVQPFTESDDTRFCDNKIPPPEDGHVNARNMSRIVEQSTLIRHTVQPFTESEDTRCCDNTICPSEDGHVNARNKSRIVM
jgi:hypothetical protein